MAGNIRVLIVDDLPETRENVRKLLQFESDIEVIGQAGTGEEAVQMAKEHQPDIILMDINMPGIDGIGASQQITESVPSVQIIIMSVQSDPNYLRRAMMAGARDFLTKPFGGDELVAAIRRVHDKRPAASSAPVRQHRQVTGNTPEEPVVAPEGNLIAVYSPKGGAGCTTAAINLAVALARRGRRTILVDGSLQFGDVSVMLNMKAVTSIADLSDRGNELDQDLISSISQIHRSNLNVLLAPPRPEMADIVTEENIKQLLASLKESFDFIIVDTTSYLSEKTLAVLDMADRIVLIAQQNLSSLKNVSRFFDLAESLEYETQKVWLVVNRAKSKQGKGISVHDVGKALKRPIYGTIPDDEITVNDASNRGIPMVMGEHQKKAISLAIIKIADQIAKELMDGKAPVSHKKEQSEKSKGLFGRLFNRREAAGG
ncbi:MAG: response regulator [Ardenticatenaceae bacterium]|nr:response regulator [Anaerolineales bacterium]MCB8938216.1 response regulator [Ardenticatenaceae bacterium]MCB8975760.1 response regulator [Ardenticatenaceae bacterium]